MYKTVITRLVILVIAAIFFAGCTSLPSSTEQSPASLKTDTEFNHLLLLPEDLPTGLIRAAEVPMQASDITNTMKKYGFQKGRRVLYANTTELTDTTKVIKQDIMIFNEANASAMMDEDLKSITAIKKPNVVAILLPNPNLGDKSYAVKVSAVDPTGVETQYYIFGFVQSGVYEVISMEGTPETYPSLLHIAKHAADKASRRGQLNI